MIVSIITPSYNQAEFLEHTMESVLRQEMRNIVGSDALYRSSDALYRSDQHTLEYIVVDGASTDGSVEIIQRYSDRLAWWTSEPDKGQADAINKGIQQAHGEIIGWLNSDDLYLPGTVQQALEVLEANPALGMVYGDAITINQLGQPLNRLAFKEWGLLDLMSFRIICQPAVFMRRQILERAGYLDSSYHFMLDHHLWLRMARLAPIQHIPLPLAAARNHPDAKNVKQAAAFGQEIFSILSWLQNQPDLEKLYTANRRKIQGGANRLKARYLLDGGQPGAALRAYSKALLYDPIYASRHWRRIIFALASWVSGARLSTVHLYRPRVPVSPLLRACVHRTEPGILPADPNLRDWPGLLL